MKLLIDIYLRFHVIKSVPSQMEHEIKFIFRHSISYKKKSSPKLTENSSFLSFVRFLFKSLCTFHIVVTVTTLNSTKCNSKRDFKMTKVLQLQTMPMLIIRCDESQTKKNLQKGWPDVK